MCGRGQETTLHGLMEVNTAKLLLVDCLFTHSPVNKTLE